MSTGGFRDQVLGQQLSALMDERGDQVVIDATRSVSAQRAWTRETERIEVQKAKEQGP